MRYLLLTSLLLLNGCNNEIYVRDGVTDGDTFYLAPVASVDTDPLLQSWVAFSLTKSVCQLELGGDNPARQNSYECELKARTILADAWAEYRVENPALADDYLDALVAVRDAGFLGGYTAHFFARSHWQIPDDADVDAFNVWRREHLRRHRPQTRIVGFWGYKNSLR